MTCAAGVRLEGLAAVRTSARELSGPQARRGCQRVGRGKSRFLSHHEHAASTCDWLVADASLRSWFQATTKLYEIAAADKDKTESGAAPAKKIKIDGRNSAKRKAETKEETTNAKQRKIEK